LTPVTITLSPAEGTSGGQFGRLTTQSNENDSFTLRNVPPGRYWVNASAPEGYIASIVAGGTNLVREPLSVSVGGGAAPIEIDVRDDSAMLTVQANGLADGSQAYFYAVPLSDAAGRMRWMTLESGKAASLSGLSPGSYRVFAFDAPQELEYHDPEAMQALGDRGKTVSLEANGQTTVQLDVVSTQ
jgi:hypothetical protein